MIHVQTLFFLQASSTSPLHADAALLSVASLAPLCAAGVASSFGAAAEFSVGVAVEAEGGCCALLVTGHAISASALTAARIGMQMNLVTKVGSVERL